MFVRNPLCVGSNTPAAVCGLVYAQAVEDAHTNFGDSTVLQSLVFQSDIICVDQ